MNKKFYELPEEKQMRIINAGFEVFGKNEYKKASTEEITSRANISKGLLFYYFHNKKSLYLFLYSYAEKLVKESIINLHFNEITDFFELCEYAALQKYKLLHKSPHIMEFIMRAFYSQREDVSDDINKKFQSPTSGFLAEYFSKIDYSKFKPEINPQDILKMLIWMTDGYLHEKQRQNTTFVLDELMDKYEIWSKMLKNISYKEEYL